MGYAKNSDIIMISENKAIFVELYIHVKLLKFI